MLDSASVPKVTESAQRCSASVAPTIVPPAPSPLKLSVDTATRMQDVGPSEQNQFLFIAMTLLYMAMNFSHQKTNSITHSLVKNCRCSWQELAPKVLFSIGIRIPISFKLVHMMGRALRNRLASGQRNKPHITLGFSMRAERYFLMNTQTSLLCKILSASINCCKI